MLKSYAGHQQAKKQNQIANARLRSQYNYDKLETLNYNKRVDQVNELKERTYQANLTNIRDGFNLGI